MQNAHSTLRPGAGLTAAVSRELAVQHAMKAEGVYAFSCFGPRESERDRYLSTLAQGARLLKLDETAGVTELREGLARATMDGRYSYPELERSMAIIFSDLEGMTESKWDDVVHNLVTTVGKNLALDTILSGSAYTVTGPFMGLINTNASAAALADTMASHAGWLEVGGANAPTYTGPRKTAAFSAAAAGSKALSSALSFSITGSGTVGGCFLVMGSGAVSTIDSTAGVLFSAGAFTGGSKVVSNGDTLSVSYTASM